MTHEIVKCCCGRVLSQCRCPSINKLVRVQAGPCRCPPSAAPSPPASAGDDVRSVAVAIDKWRTDYDVGGIDAEADDELVALIERLRALAARSAP